MLIQGLGPREGLPHRVLGGIRIVTREACTHMFASACAQIDFLQAIVRDLVGHRFDTEW